MKRTPVISGTGSIPGQGNTAHSRPSLAFIITLSVLGAMFVVSGVFTIVLYRLFISTGEYGLLTYFSGMLAIGAFLVFCAFLASLSRKKKAVSTSAKVRAALVSTLQRDSNPYVRSKAAEGLADLDLEESTEHLKHDDLDAVLISTLQRDPDPGVRSKAAEGLSEVELEQSTYHHQHK